MITSPSFYRTINKQETVKTAVLSHLIKRLMKRHAAKIVVCSAVFALLFTSFLLLGTDASGSHPAGATAEEHMIVVHTGDTLWEIAKQFTDGKQDIRFVIYLIKDRNNLQSSEIMPGQKLIIPSI
jgi:LysM repeat protein